MLLRQLTPRTASWETRGAAGVEDGGEVVTTDEVLKQLLSGTGLTYRYVNDKAITILPVSEASAGGAARLPSSLRA